MTRRGSILPSPGSGSYVAPDAIERLTGEARKRLPELRALLRELRLAGIAEDEINAAVSEVYGDSTPNETEHKEV